MHTFKEIPYYIFIHGANWENYNFLKLALERASGHLARESQGARSCLQRKSWISPRPSSDSSDNTWFWYYYYIFFSPGSRVQNPGSSPYFMLCRITHATPRTSASRDWGFEGKKNWGSFCGSWKRKYKIAKIRTANCYTIYGKAVHHVPTVSFSKIKKWTSQTLENIIDYVRTDVSLTGVFKIRAYVILCWRGRRPSWLTSYNQTIFCKIEQDNCFCSTNCQRVAQNWKASKCPKSPGSQTKYAAFCNTADTV